MKAFTFRSAVKAALIGAAFVSLQACSPATPGAGAGNGTSQVAQAFESSDALNFKPYTRTIFSSTGF